MKLPFSLSLHFAFRILLPSLVVAIGLLPVIALLHSEMFQEWHVAVIFVAVWVALGWGFLICDMPIYMLLEGRKFWPQILFNIGIKSEKRRLNKHLNRITSSTQPTDTKPNDYKKYIESSVLIRQFPIAKNSIPSEKMAAYIAISPTRLGNLIASYEQYPQTRYGIDGIFFWYRIWLLLDDHQKRDLENRQSIADSIVYTSISLLCVAFLCICYFLLDLILPTHKLNLPFEGLHLILLSVIFNFSSYLFYRISLFAHASYGNLFAAVFDLYFPRLETDHIVKYTQDIQNKRTSVNNNQFWRFKVAWRYLHNFRIKQSAEDNEAHKEQKAIQILREVSKGRTVAEICREFKIDEALVNEVQVDDLNTILFQRDRIDHLEAENLSLKKVIEQKFPNDEKPN